MNATTSKKITLATFKAFIRKNADRLYIMNRSHFDGMTDGRRPAQRTGLAGIGGQGFNLLNIGIEQQSNGV